MAWTKTFTAQKIGSKDNLWASPPTFAGMHEQEQYRAAVSAADALIQSKTIGTGTTYTVTLSGTGNPGHPTSDTITVTVTNAN
jgi:hypothetical protein